MESCWFDVSETGMVAIKLRGGESTSVGRSVRSLRLSGISIAANERGATIGGGLALEGEQGAERKPCLEISCRVRIPALVGVPSTWIVPDLGEGVIGLTIGERELGMTGGLGWRGGEISLMPPVEDVTNGEVDLRRESVI